MSEPEKLYHYTNVAAFFDIVSSGYVRLTEVSLSNDSQEIEYAKKLFRGLLSPLRGTANEKADGPTASLRQSLQSAVDQYIARATPASPQGPRGKLRRADASLRELRGKLDRSVERAFQQVKFSRRSVFAFSLCDMNSLNGDGSPVLLRGPERAEKLPDSLTQWRAYGANGRGVAFSMPTEVFKQLDEADPNGLRIHFDKVEYREAEQVKRASKLIKECFGPKALAEAPTEESLWQNFVSRAWELLPFIKHPEFAVEREWRVVLSGEVAALRDHIGHFRRQDDLQVSYVRFDGRQLLNHEDIRVRGEVANPAAYAKLPIASVWLGPTSDKARYRASIASFLEFHGYRIAADEKLTKDGEVRLHDSDIPYRP